MSLSSALSIALSGLSTSTTAAQVISGNIANAQTPGYTAKTADLAAVITGTSLGGVSVSGYSRVTDAILSATYNSATSSASYLNTQSGYMAQVQSILDSTNNPPALADDVAKFQAAWAQYAANPSDVTLQQTVISAGSALAGQISTTASQTATLRTNVINDLSTTVQTLNSDLSQVQTLNVEITEAMSHGQPTVNLEDQRDTLVNQISQFTNVTQMQRSNGQIALYTINGTALLDQQAQVFHVGSDPVTGDPCVMNAIGGNISGQLTGGSLQAQTDFLSSSTSAANGVGIINKMNAQLTAFANMFVSTATGGFANIYNSATTAAGELASSFFTASQDANSNINDLSTMAVNASLINGTKKLKTAAAVVVSNTFTATNLAINTATIPPTTSSTFSATGINVQNQTYATIATSILSGYQQMANIIKSQSTAATTQQNYYKNSLSSETGVNTDTELVNLSNWENSYAASAHVISTIQQMMSILENMVSG